MSKAASLKLKLEFGKIEEFIYLETLVTDKFDEDK